MKKALIVVSTEKPKAESIGSKITDFLTSKHIGSTIYSYKGFSHLPELKNEFDFAVSLGGDGTVLFTARYCAPRNIPVFPINLGRFGFIANIEPDEWQPALEKFLAAKLELHERLLISAAVKRGKNGRQL